MIDLLGEEILKYDLSHIKGEEIVGGNPEHCINLLQLVQEISLMMVEKKGDGAAAEGAEGAEVEDDEAEVIHERKPKN